jgi:hypothetical protein
MLISLLLQLCWKLYLLLDHGLSISSLSHSSLFIVILFSAFILFNLYFLSISSLFMPIFSLFHAYFSCLFVSHQVLTEAEFLLRLREKQRAVSDAKNRKRTGLGVRPGGKGGMNNLSFPLLTFFAFTLFAFSTFSFFSLFSLLYIVHFSLLHN